MKKALLALGIIFLLVGGVTAAGLFKFQKTESVADIGSLEIQKTEEHQLPLNIGYVLLGLGAISVVASLVVKR